MSAVLIRGLGTVTPRGSFAQETAIPLAADRCCHDERERQWLERIYRASGVQRRGSVLLDRNDDAASIEAFYPPRTSIDDRGRPRRPGSRATPRKRAGSPRARAILR
ncbi:MAG TPA: hypothetical protein VFH71_07900 [Rhodanobacteraceae bacterium]|nr:hypothetical protein [Rhodanobacteraceae bacterium]